MEKRVKPWLTAFLCLLLACGSIVAQTGTSAIRGTVLDPQKAAVAGATVTLTSLETNTVRTKTTNEAGSFVFDLIPPGAYRLEVEGKGFKKTVINDVRALVDKSASVDVMLETGQITESVTVQAGSGEVSEGADHTLQSFVLCLSDASPRRSTSLVQASDEDWWQGAHQANGSGRSGSRAVMGRDSTALTRGQDSVVAVTDVRTTSCS